MPFFRRFIKMVQTYFSKQVSFLRKTFNFKKPFWSTYFLDVLYYFLLIAGFLLWIYVLIQQAQGIQQADFGVLFSGTGQQITDVYSTLKSFFIALILTLSLFLLYIMLLMTFFKGFIWSKLLTKKVKFAHYVKLFFTTFVGFILFLTLFVISSLTKQNILAAVILLLAVYLYSLFLYFFTKSGIVFSSLGKMFKMAVRVDKLVFFFVVSILSLVIYDLTLAKLLNSIALPLALNAFINLFCVVFILVVIRRYFIIVLDNLS